jgi:cytochrome c-type biogenesis protein
MNNALQIWGLAFTAGMVSTVNPCGFAMLPAYLSYFLGLEGKGGEAKATPGRSLAVGAVTSAGFFVVFGVAGLLLNAGVDRVRDWLPYLAIVIGVGIALLGIAMLRGFELSVALPKAQGGTGSRQWRSMFVFGMSYATASLSCTLPAFLVVVVGSLSGESFLTGIGTFFAYSLGMSVILISLTVSLGAAQKGLLSRLRNAMQYVNRISAVIMIVAGVYITWFWSTELLNDGSDSSVAEGLVDGWSGSLTRFIEDNVWFLSFFLGGIIVAAIVSQVWRPRELAEEPGGTRRSTDMTHVDALSEAVALVNDSALDLRTLEPAAPASTDADFLADDPAAVGSGFGGVVTPTSAGQRSWADLVAERPGLTDFAERHWLTPGRRLGPAPSTLVSTRNDLHRLAYSVVARARHASNGKFGLRYTAGGLGTPFYGDDEQVRVDGTDLVVVRGNSIERTPISTLAAAGATVGVEPAFEPAAEHDSLELGDVDRVLDLDTAAMAFLGDWFGFGTALLEELRVTPGAEDVGRVQLWPGHLDPAVEVGCQDAGQRATYGASPGDHAHDEPYLYVGAWGDVDRSDPYWNETNFNGASLPYAEIVAADDQFATALDFLRAGLSKLTA